MVTTLHLNETAQYRIKLFKLNDLILELLAKIQDMDTFYIKLFKILRNLKKKMQPNFFKSLPIDLQNDLLHLVICEEKLRVNYDDLAFRMQPFIADKAAFNKVFAQLTAYFIEGFSKEEQDIMFADIPRKKNKVADNLGPARAKQKKLLKRAESYVMKLKKTMFPDDDKKSSEMDIVQNDVIPKPPQCVPSNENADRIIDDAAQDSGDEISITESEVIY